MRKTKTHARKTLMLFFALSAYISGYGQYIHYNQDVDTIWACSGDTVHFMDYYVDTFPLAAIFEYANGPGNTFTTNTGTVIIYLLSTGTGDLFKVIYIIHDSLHANTLSISALTPPNELCPTSQNTLQASSGYTDYIWSNGQTGQQIQATPNTYSVSAKDGWCTYADTFTLSAHQVKQNQVLCIVTVDTATGRNLIVWEKDPSDTFGIAAYKIYKRNQQTSAYDSIGVVPKDSLSTFIDVNSNPPQQSSSYAISVIDELCGHDESNISAAHTTVHLSANVGVNGQVNLAWNAYQGFEYSSFEIYRSNNGGAFEQIGNTDTATFAYTDLTPPSGTNYYYVAVTRAGGCNPTRAITSSISNVLNPAETPTGISSVSKDNVSVYPNPFTDKLTIKPNVSYQLFDLVGREVDKNNLSKLPVGIYVLKTEKGSTRVTKINE